MKTILLLVLGSISFSATGQIFWLKDIDKAQKVAMEEKKFIVMDFWATWCGPCLTMDRTMWNSPVINSVAGNFVALKINVDRNKSLAAKYSARSIPKVVIMDPAGNIVWEQVGFAKPDPFLEAFEQLPESKLTMENLVKEQEDVGDINSWREIAVSYQQMGKDLKSFKLQNGFLNTSDKYLRKIEKSAADESLTTEAKLHRILNMAYRGKTKHALKQLNKDANLELEFAYFINAYCYKCLGNTEEMQKFLNKITDRNLLAQFE